MSFSFSINSKSQPNRLKKPIPAAFSDAGESDSSNDDARASKIEPIAPLPNTWLSNLPLFPQFDSALQFEVEPSDSNPDTSSTKFDPNLRQPSPATGIDGGETSINDYDDVPVEAFGFALMTGYGWKRGRGIGRKIKEDVKVHEFIANAGRAGLGFTGELPGEDVRRKRRTGEA